METKKTVLSVAAAGTVAGVAGLVLLASPAGAGEAPPALPDISADELVESVLTTDELPAMSGSVAMANNLGLPLPGMPAETSDAGIRVFTDGDGRGRLQVPGDHAETTIVDDGTTVWVWNSEDRTVAKMPHGPGEHAEKPIEGRLADPATAARDLVEAVREYSTVEVDGTARVAERPVYQLVLAPKPSERTLLREVRVSVDSELRVPLQVEVLANGQADPALKVGFTEFQDGPQDESLFRFTPPEGATVTEENPRDQLPAGRSPEDLFGALDLRTYGEGWDTVLTGTIPGEALRMPTGDLDGRGNGNPLELLGSLGKQVSGDFGTGYVIETHVGTAIVTEDGRVAVGAVPEQVVIEAVEQLK